MIQFEYLTLSTGALGADSTSSLAAVATLDLPAKGAVEWELVSAVLVPDLASASNHRIMFFLKRPVEPKRS